jgi:hypothetical protein
LHRGDNMPTIDECRRKAEECLRPDYVRSQKKEVEERDQPSATVNHYAFQKDRT